MVIARGAGCVCARWRSGSAAERDAASTTMCRDHDTHDPHHRRVVCGFEDVRDMRLGYTAGAVAVNQPSGALLQSCPTRTVDAPTGGLTGWPVPVRPLLTPV